MNSLKLIGFRHDNEDLTEFFSKNCRDNEKALVSHFPFVVFSQRDYELEVRIVKDINELLHYDDNTQVIKQWGGKMRSDYFHFTIGQLRAYLKANPKEAYPKGEWQF